MIPTFGQRGYLSNALKVNRNAYKELNKMFPKQINGGADNSLADLEAKVSRLDYYQVFDVIAMLKDDKIVEGFTQLNHLIKEH